MALNSGYLGHIRGQLGCLGPALGFRGEASARPQTNPEALLHTPGPCTGLTLQKKGRGIEYGVSIWLRKFYEIIDVIFRSSGSATWLVLQTRIPFQARKQYGTLTTRTGTLNGALLRRTNPKP